MFLRKIKQSEVSSPNPAVSFLIFVRPEKDDMIELWN